jgi:hypothetical protein
MAPIRLRLPLGGHRCGNISGHCRASANLVFQADSKFSQAQPSKIKQKPLDFLDFIRPNWDFSMGYGDSKQEYKKAIFSFLGLSRPIKTIDTHVQCVLPAFAAFVSPGQSILGSWRSAP